jgi:hypothetical protein
MFGSCDFSNCMQQLHAGLKDIYEIWYSRDKDEVVLVLN